MKKLLLSFITLFGCSLTYGQLLNGNFESWSTTTWEQLDSVYRTSVAEVVASGTPSNASKIITNPQHRNHSIKLESVVAGNDTTFGYFIHGDIGDNGPERGIRFTQKPDTAHGYYKSNLLAGDTAILIVIFWQNDTVRSTDIQTFTGVQTAWTKFSLPLNISTATVDSITFAAVSANPFNGQTPTPGTWIQLDNIWFSGTGLTQNIPNPSFESWVSVNVETPDDWFTFNKELKAYIDTVHVQKVSPAYKGNYALQLTSFWLDSNNIASIANAEFGDSGITIGGAAYANQIDTLCGWYKYTPNGTDTAAVSLSFSKNDTVFSWQGRQLMAAASYTYFEVPFNLVKAPDTVVIYISSSSYNIGGSGAGSVLIIDELQFKSAPLNTGIPTVAKGVFGSRLYPNPAKDFVKVEYELSENATMFFTVYDITGREVFKKEYANQNMGNNQILFNTSALNSGIYIYRINSEKGVLSTGKFTKE